MTNATWEDARALAEQVQAMGKGHDTEDIHDESDCPECIAIRLLASAPPPAAMPAEATALADTFRHYHHANPEKGNDHCARCGLDLFDVIHLRMGDGHSEVLSRDDKADCAKASAILANADAEVVAVRKETVDLLRHSVAVAVGAAGARLLPSLLRLKLDAAALLDEIGEIEPTTTETTP